jgi:hypothetical protein
MFLITYPRLSNCSNLIFFTSPSLSSSMEIWLPKSSYKQIMRKSGSWSIKERDGDEDVFININEDINGVLRSLTDEQKKVRVGADKAIIEAGVPSMSLLEA